MWIWDNTSSFVLVIVTTEQKTITISLNYDDHLRDEAKIEGKILKELALSVCYALLWHEDFFFRLLVVHEIRQNVSMNETKHWDSCFAKDSQNISIILWVSKTNDIATAGKFNADQEYA